MIATYFLVGFAVTFLMLHRRGGTRRHALAFLLGALVVAALCLLTFAAIAPATGPWFESLAAVWLLGGTLAAILGPALGMLVALLVRRARSRTRSGAAAVILGLAALNASPVLADALSIRCTKKGAASPVTLIYEGDATGTLAVKAGFGEMTLEATKEQREGEFEGMHLSVTAIRAFGRATLSMPDSTAVESCIAGRKAGGDPDEDTLYLHILACTENAEPGPAVPVTAKVSIAIADPPAVNVEISRTYEAPSAAAGRRIAVETFLGQCAVAD